MSMELLLMVPALAASPRHEQDGWTGWLPSSLVRMPAHFLSWLSTSRGTALFSYQSYFIALLSTEP